MIKVLVLGDFRSAVSICLSVERYINVIVFAVKRGAESLHNTEKTYFEKRTAYRLTLLRWIGPEGIILQTLARSVRRSGTRCSCTRRVLHITLVRDLNVIWGSIADRAEEIHVLSPDVVVRNGGCGHCQFSVRGFLYINDV